MDDSAKLEMKNYGMAGGFFVIALISFLSVLNLTSQELLSPSFGMIHIYAAVVLVLFGLILVFLRSRDLTAITFLLYGGFYLFTNLSFGLSVTTARYFMFLFGIFFILLGLVILTAKDRKKYLLVILPFLQGSSLLLGGLTLLFPSLCLVLVLGGVALYFALAAASEKFHFPGTALLTADVVTDFRSTGSVLGYFFFAASTAGYALYRFTNGTLPFTPVVAIDLVSGFFLIFVGVLLFAAAKMRFTPVFFMLLGFIIIVGTQISGSGYYIIGLMLILLGLLTVLRIESRLLPGIMVIVYAFAYIFAALTLNTTTAPLIQGLLNLVPCLIAIYLAFAVFSQNKKLPLF